MILSPLFPYASALAAALLALGSLFRTKRTTADWTFAAGMVVLAVENLASGLSLAADSTEQMLYWQQVRLLALSLLSGTWLLFSLSYARGNAGDFLAKWRLALAAAFLLPVVIALAFRSSLVIALPEVAPGASPIVQLGWSGSVLNLLLLAGSVMVLMNLERTFRASVGTMRWRIKFMILGVGLLFIVRLYTSSQALLYRGMDLSLQNIASGAVLVAAVLMTLSLIRTGRFNLDIYPSQSVLEGSFTILLAGIYLVVVGVFAKIVTYFGGDSAFALSAFLVLVSLVLLTILLQSDRLRLYVRRFISRNFQRPLYDYRTMWRKFTEGTATRVEQTDLCRSLVRLTAEMFQALSVSIWLVDEKGEAMTLAASTSLSEAESRDTGALKADSAEVIRHFEMHQEPADIEGSRSPWAAALREWNPGKFPNGGHRVCIPLIGRGEMLGLITLGDRVSGATYSIQDFDMLKCIGDHAAASLLNVRLSQKLLQAKELEAFQTMAAFFVHDLKNAASTLNLMLQNLPLHFDDPEFREDALRGTSKTVAHINHLIGRLSMLRHELKTHPEPTDLNELLGSALTDFKTGDGKSLNRDFTPVPKIMIDRDQMKKVVTNLVLNAVEAVAAPEGRVQISTKAERGWVVLSVSDNGCGMNPDFLKQSLFRPFQTTKKSGLGIGMFQSKMIVEAHHGRITATSEAGQGTTFQVFLPVE